MTTEDFRPTHVVPPNGLPAWESPDVSRPTEPLDPLLPVQVLDRRGDWGLIACANGWSAWVDGRLLVSVPQGAPAAVQPPARTADPRPMLARVQESLSQYRRAAEDLADGRTDGESFRRHTQGLRVGMVVEGEAVWLYDAEHERWLYCDGLRLSTYAASSAASFAASAAGGDRPPAHEPTRVVAPAPHDTGGTPAPGLPPDEPAPPEPTQVVAARPPTPGPFTSDPAAAAPAASSANSAHGPEPTRIPGHAETPPSGPPAGPEATRVVGGAAPREAASAARRQPTRVVSGAAEAPEPTPAPQAEAGDDDQATRPVRPDRRSGPEPPTRPGDGQ
ncbi:hypothetical protein [Streptomyces hypolithicus]